ncbi:MAG: glycosyltransferase [Thermoanaerobaculales bacterium]|nr:glycosyltransferase [Thermoanaerobaculales bacterium]
MSASIRAVVVRWRGGDEVRRCLGSLLANAGPRVARVVLVDSGSGDGAAARLASDFPDVEAIALAENRGFAFAADRGAGEGPEPLLLLLNPDIEVEAGAVDSLVNLLEDRPRAAGVVPLLEGLDGASQYQWQLRRLPGAVRLAFGLSGAPAFSSPPQTPAVVPQPAAAAWLVRRTVWEALGGLDPTFEPAWWEDVDFCARLRDRLGEAGFPADEGFVVEPAARLRHGGGSSVAALGRDAFFTAYYTNLLRYTARHHPGRLGLIRKGLQVSLGLRMLLRPSQRKALGAALDAVKTATPAGRGGSPPGARGR